MEDNKLAAAGANAEQNNVSGKDNQSFDTSKDYLDAIKDLKQNSVSRDEYNKVRAENKQLLEAVVNNQSIEIDTSSENKETVQDLRKDLYAEGNSEQMTNLEYWEKTLKLREELMKQGKADPFEAGNEGVSSPKDFVHGQDVADTIQSCIDVANGDPAIFNMEYKRRIRTK